MSSLQLQNLIISVDNPQKHLTALESYISFRVTTKMKEESSDEPESYIVRRRYNDFLWLRNKLIEAFPTLIVPALPGKHGVLGQLDRYSRSFIMCRMALLDSYLQRLASHPVFCSSSMLKIFLTAKSSEFSMHSKGSEGLFDKISGSIQNIAGFLPKYSQLNCEFETTRQYVTDLSKKFSNLQSVTNRIHKERSDLNSELEEAQLTVKSWSDHEPGLKTSLKGIQDALIATRDCHRFTVTDTYSKKIQHPLEEYILYLEAIKEALNRRDAIQLSFETTVEEGNRKKAEREQLRALQAEANGFGFRLWKLSAKEKVKRLQHEIPNLDKLTEENLDKMEIANEAIRADLDRWSAEKKFDIKNILNSIADQHIDYYTKSVEIWENTLSAIQNCQLQSQ